MKIVDLSHMMNVHTPGWVGYAGNQMYYVQNLQSKMIVAQRIETAMHAGTHIDGAMHATDVKGDMASYPLDYLVSAGAAERLDDATLSADLLPAVRRLLKDATTLETMAAQASMLATPDAAARVAAEVRAIVLES